MMRHSYELDGTILKSNEALTLSRSDKASIEIGKGTLALSIKNENVDVGYVFFGQGRMLVDAIVETEDGAVGKPIERDLKEPFLMLGDSKQISRHLSSASDEDLKSAAADEKMFRDKAQGLLNRFSSRNIAGASARAERNDGWIFAFADGEDELETLLMRGSELIYATKETSYISNRDKSILCSSGKVILSDRGRSLIVDKPHLSHGCC